MKKLLALVCMITCIFGLTGCGSEVVYTDHELKKMETACSVTTQKAIPVLVKYSPAEMQDSIGIYNAEEISYVMASENQLNVEGYAFFTALDSFEKSLEEVGEIKGFGEISAEIDDDQIIVHAEVLGTAKNAEAELIFSNDMFMMLESAALNVEASKGEMMTDAALNTVIGMATVFMVLIIMIIVISSFSLISKVQGSPKEKKSSAQTVGIEKAVAQIVGREERVDVDSNPELVAVIAAAIAASEGATSTDGFVVRSIIRRR